MKKELLIIFLLIILVFPITTKAIATNSSDIKYTNIYFFSDNDCQACETGKQWLENYTKENNEINIEYLNVSKNKELYDNLKEALNIKTKKLPLIIIGSNYFIGFNNNTKTNITKAVDAYKEHEEDYCEIISKVKNKEEVKDCLKQNKKIYKQSKNITFFKIIIIIGIACLIIGGCIIVKKKKLLSRLHR